MQRLAMLTLTLAVAMALSACDDSSVFENKMTPPSQRTGGPAAPANLPDPVEGLDPTFNVEVPEDSPLWDSNDPAMSEQAPEKYRVTFATSRGQIVIEVTRAWSPKGADRFYNLTRHGFYDSARFFRVLPGFMAQFGLPGNPKLTDIWRNQPIQDEPVLKSNTRAKVTYAMAGPNTRTSQVFINYGNNATLDRQGFTPFGEVIEGMDVVESLYNAYGEGYPRGQGPDQGQLVSRGNEYLSKAFPNLDYIVSTKVEAIGDDVAAEPADDAADASAPADDAASDMKEEKPAASETPAAESEAPESPATDENASAAPVTPLD